MLTRAVVAWLAILPLAILNGVFREAVLAQNLPVFAANALSGLILAAAIIALAVALAGWAGFDDRPRALRAGALWFSLTLIFETGFGLARGLGAAQILRAYTFEDGDLWPLVLAVTFLAPAIAGAVRGRRPARPGGAAGAP